MSVTATPIFPQTVKNFVAKILPATASGIVVFVTGGANGTKIESISVVSTDTISRDVQLVMTVNSVDHILTTISIPFNSGNTSGVPAVDLLRSMQWSGLSYDACGNKILYIASGAVLSIKSLTTVTAAKEINAFAFGGDY